MLSVRLLGRNFLHKHKSFSLLPTLSRCYGTVWLSTDSPEYVDHAESIRDFYPESDIPKPVEYNGTKKIRVAYVLDRNPYVCGEIHPIVQDFEKLKEDNVKRFARHQYTSFVDYYPVWRQAYNKLSEKVSG